MRLLLPLTQDPRGGIGRVAATLARALPEGLGPDDRLTVFGDLDGLPVHPRVTVHPVELDWSRGRRVVREQLVVPRLARRADLVHLGDHRPLLSSRTPFTFTMHDLGLIDHPDWYPPRTGAYKRAMLRATLAKRPAGVVCVSQWCRERLLAFAPGLEDRTDLRVINPGVELPAALPADRVPEPYFLTVSAIEPRKNHLGLLAAFREARRRGLRLSWRVVGRPLYLGEEIVAQMAATPGVELTGSLDQAGVEAAFAGAAFVATPSHEEGFGYPPLEAMARGIPSVCSTGSALDETVGDAALRVAPTDVDGWADALLRLEEDAALRAALVARGQQRVRRFPPARAASAHLELFRALTT